MSTYDIIDNRKEVLVYHIIRILNSMEEAANVYYRVKQ